MKIKNYNIREKLFTGKRFTIYRACGEHRGASKILKVLDKNTSPDIRINDTLKHEYHLLGKVASPYVIKAIDLIDDNDYAIMILEDIGGQSLKQAIKKKGGPFPVEQFIPLALKITKGLAAVHSKNIIHKDINPTNIIRSPQTGDIKIIDFNIASTYDINVSFTGSPEKLQGTLPYISPEQTGRLNRRVDQRSDLYSLGVTFYEMLTGRLPFHQSKPIEIVYAHLARAPEPPHIVNEQVPEVLSKIVLRQLAKDPNQRYQSAEGLKQDLEKAVKLNFEDFELGEKDFSGALQISEELYGREKEIQQLLSAYQKVSKGTKQMILVAGYSGTGKTSLVNEIHVPITKNRGFFISGKFDQLQRTVPYFAFVQAFNQFCQLLLSETEAVLAQWQERILNAVGELGKVLTDIIPQLEYVIGKQPDFPEVGGEEAKKRFNYVFQRFIQAVSSEEHPLVIFIDDLQWADLASMDLLQAIIEDTQIRHLLFIGAYRDNEVSSIHPLMTTLEEIQKQGVATKTIPVTNLSLENVIDWLHDTLKTCSNIKIKNVVSLAELIYQKTQGNAFFTARFLENLYKENLLRFDFNQTKWEWDVREIEKQNISDNVVDLLTSKIQTLQAEAQEALKLGACIGNVFDLHTLSIISGKTGEVMEKCLEIALTERLIYPVEEDRYRFGHDRIHQAAYSIIAVEDKKPLHLKIGRLLLENFEKAKPAKNTVGGEQNIFDIVNHLNMGIDLMKNASEKIQLARLNYNAGQKARASTAYQLSRKYLKKAVKLLPPDCWRAHFKLTLSIYNEVLQAAYLCGEYEEMNLFMDRLSEFSREESEKATAYEYILMSLLAQKKLPQAVEKVIELMNKMGIHIPRSFEKSELEALFKQTKKEIKDLDIDQLKNLPPITDVNKQIVMRLYIRSSTVMYFNDQALYSYMINKMILFSLKHGITPETAYLFAEYGLLNSAWGDIDQSYRFGKLSMELLKQTNANDSIKGRTYLIVGLYIFCWKEPSDQVAALLFKGSHYSLNSGDLEMVGYLVTNYLITLLETDINLSQYRTKVNAALKQLKQIKQQVPAIWVKTLDIFSTALCDYPVTPGRANPFVDILAAEQQDFGGTIKYNRSYYQLLLSYIFDDIELISESIQGLEESWEPQKATVRFTKATFLTALGRLRAAEEKNSGTEKEMHLEKAEEVLKKTKILAESTPGIHQHRYYLLKAELLRVTGKYLQIGELYDKSIQWANDNRFLPEEAIANELAAKFYMQQDRHKLAALYFLEARDCYRRWGAAAKVKHLEENYPKYLSMRAPGAALSSTGTISSSSTDTTGELLDVKSIIKASQTLSGEMQLGNFLEKMMNILIQNAGAQKGLFIEKSDESLLIQAEGNKDAVSGILAALPVEESNELPLPVINYVARGKKKLVFDNISKDAAYSTDKYIQKQQIKSVVCFPILRHEALSAIIYLENNLVEGAFTPERVEVLNTLSSQIAISMENARIYRDLDELNKSLEQKVAERTEQLHEQTVQLQEQSKKLKDMDKIKSRFFANISHEFRTPLTLIMGPLEQRLDLCGDQQQIEEMQMMLRNSRRLLTLINQLLDLSKLESGRMMLQAAEQDVIPFLKGVVFSFESLTQQKELDLAFQTEQENIPLFYDTEKLEKIVVNLVANAIKFTPAGGKVTVTAAEYPPGKEETNQKFCGGPGGDFSKEPPGFHPLPTWWACRRQEYPDGCLIIKVCDTGPGIPEDQLPYVFDRFYQAGSSTDREKRGTGIGLALVKELVELHHGEVFVESTEGKGSEFTVYLLLGKDHLEAEEIITAAQMAPSPPPPTFVDLESEPLVEEEKEIVVVDIETGEQEKDVVLIVEDNPDVRTFIRGPLTPHYRVMEAANGREGIEKAKKIIPDLIVSDIMMPEVDGYELCSVLKKDVKTSHIPIVMLTAKASEQSVIQGLETGADDYITKPFNTQILLTRIKNLIDLRRGLQEKIQRELVLQPTEIAISSVDQEFMKELKKAIEKNMSEEDFSVDKLAQALYMGRATLNRKIKAITGESTNQFIQSYRLKRAAQLLKANFGNVTEVSFEVGFSSSAYFTKCFREKFHQPPHTYLAAEGEVS